MSFARMSCQDIRKTVLTVTRALAEDARCRVPGVTEGLYGIDDLRPFARLGHGLPLISHENHHGHNFARRAASDAEFLERFRAVAPFFDGFDLKAHGLVLAGGAASALLMNPETAGALYFHDYDFFLVGHESDEAARAAISALGDHLHSQWGEETKVYRTQGCVTFHGGSGGAEAGPRIVQVILRRYSTLAEVIHGFDFGASAVAFDGETVRLTALGKLAANHGAIVLNLQARRASYERRIARYFGRGYDLVLPDLDAAQLIDNNGRLPYLYFAGIRKADNCGCRLTAWNLYPTRPHLNEFGQRYHVDGDAGDASDAAPPELDETSDYAFGEIYYGNSRKILGRNIRALADAPVRTASLCASAPYRPGLDVTTVGIELDPEVAAEMVRWAFGGAKVQMKTIIALAGADGAVALMLDYVQRGCKPPEDETIREAFRANTRALRERPEFAIPFAFMRVEDKTALTGPFLRELVSAAQWYGEAFAV